MLARLALATLVVVGGSTAWGDEMATSSESSADRGAQHPAALRLKAGALIARGNLNPGLLIGLEGSRRIWRKLSVSASLDWVRLTETHNSIVGPSAYPRARADLSQQSDLFAVQVGADWTLTQFAGIALFGGAQAGVSVARASLEAFSETHKENDINGIVTLRTGLAGTAGPVSWVLEAGWRESSHDLGASGEFAEETTSGLVLSAGLGTVF